MLRSVSGPRRRAALLVVSAAFVAVGCAAFDAADRPAPENGSDAGVAGSTDGDAAGACTFCDDFTRANPVDVRGAWTALDVQLAKVEVVADPERADNTVLAVTLDALTADTGPSKASLVRVLPPPRDGVSFAFRVRPERSSPERVQIFYLDVEPAGDGGAEPYRITFFADNGALTANERIGGPAQPARPILDQPADAALAPGQWSTVVGELSFGSSTRFELSVNGRPIVPSSLTMHAHLGRTQIAVGSHFRSGPDPAAKLWFDDVQVVVR